MNYYNDNDPNSVAWLKQLIIAGLIPKGDVDARSIADIKGSELSNYTQCHFFAGIAGWAEALRLSNFPADQKVWTGSCPCQPFSAAGRHKGTKDKRHLWPELRRLIAECHPPVVIGEQVASKAGREWLSRVRLDLEELGYAVGCADLCAASAGEDGEVGIVRGGEIEWCRAVIGAPHIRQRLWWVADAGRKRYERRRESGIFPGATGDSQDSVQEREWRGDAASNCGTTCGICGAAHPEESECQPLGVGDTDGQRHARQHSLLRAEERGWDAGTVYEATRSRTTGDNRISDSDVPRLERSERTQLQGRGGGSRIGSERREWDAHIVRPVIENQTIRHPQESDSQRGSADFWSGFDLIPCLDSKARRVEPGTFPLVDGGAKGMGRGGDPSMEIDAQATPEARLMRLKGYGNAIVPQVAAAFIRAWMEVSESL